MSYSSNPDYGVRGNRSSSYHTFPAPSKIGPTPPPSYFPGELTNEPASYTPDNYHSSPRPPIKSPGYVGGFHFPARSTDYRVNPGHRSGQGHSYSTPTYDHRQPYGSQQGSQQNVTPPRFPMATGALLPSYTSPPPYPPSSAPSLASTPSSSGSGITAEDVRPGDLKFNLIKWGIDEMTTCKDIFLSWSEDLDGCKNSRNSAFEEELVKLVRDLRDEASEALESSHLVLQSYLSFARCMKRNLRNLSQKGGQLYEDTDIRKLGDEVSSHSRTLSERVAVMKDKLGDLVDKLDTTRRDSSKHLLWEKIWRWLVRTFKILAGVLAASAVIAPIVHPVGAVASAVMAGLTKLATYAAEVCTDLRNHASQDVVFDKIVDLLRFRVPEAAKKAELALNTFQTCQHVLLVGLQVEERVREGWMSATEAAIAAKDWSTASEELHKVLDVPKKASTI